MNRKNLGDISVIEISGVDKKKKENEKEVHLCNFTDVYHNWTILKKMEKSFMKATANEKEISKFKLKKGHVAITKDSETRNDIGMSCYINDDFKDTILGYHCALIKPDNNIINGEYLNAYLNSSMGRKYFESRASGSGQRYTLSREAISSIKIPILSMKEQERIGGFFTTIDKKIKKNLETNIKLEQIAKTIFDYWFLQYEFPNSLNKPYKTNNGELKWSNELQKYIPIDWNAGTLGDLFDSQSGYAFKSKDWKEYGHPVLTIKAINEDGSINIKDATFIDKNYDEKYNKYSVENGNMIFAMSGNTIGKLGIVSSAQENILINQRVLIIKTNIDSLAYPYFTIKDRNIQNHIFKLGANSAQPNISEEELRGIKICMPSKSCLIKYNSTCKDLFNKIIKNRIEIEHLENLRDYLLPLIINGQVTFKDL